MRRRFTLLLSLCALSSCAPETGEAPRAARSGAAPAARGSSSLLLVTLDTFRADAAGCGGNPAGRTPWLDRLARTGIQWEEAVAGSPLTLPSHASMMTGLEGPAHGIRDNGTFRLPEGIPTLAEALRARGFATGAFVAAFPLEHRFGLARGFDVYDDTLPETGGPTGVVMAQRSGSEVARAAGAWWESLPPGRRWFAWVHLFDAHQPYDSPPALRRATGQDPYAADVFLADRWLGRTVRAARQHSSPPWIVVLGDHGESRGEHGESTHGLFLYESTVRVPALLWPRPPQQAPGPRGGVFRTIDLPATCFELLDLEAKAAPGRGISALQPPERRATYMETFFPRLHYGWSELRALRAGRWKYVEAPEAELYDLARDPAEERNVAPEHPEQARALARLLREHASGARESPRVPLDEEARAALESLGYTAGPAPSRGEAPDPKRMITVVRLLDTVQARIARGRWAEALSPLRRALSLDPQNKEVHQILGMAFAALGRDREAVDAYRRCLELPPHENDRIPRFELASAYLRLGKAEEAAQLLEQILAAEPDDASSWYNLGVARKLQNRPQEARQAWERALEADPKHDLARRSLGHRAQKARR